MLRTTGTHSTRAHKHTPHVQVPHSWTLTAVAQLVVTPEEITLVIAAMPTIASMTRAQLQSALRELGEEPPEQWKNAEMKVRLMELEEEKGLDQLRRTRHQGTELMTWVTRLNQASKKKASMQEFCTSDLGLTLTGSETMMTLQKLGMEKIYVISQPDGQDPMGFGTHASRTYAEVKQTFPDYCQWAKTTAREGQHSVRLGRFVKWLEMTPKEYKNKPSYMTQVGKVKMGDVKQEPMAPEATPSESSQGSTQALMKAQNMMMEMMTQMAELKEGMEELRQERPRKRVEGNTEDSFSMVSK